MNNKRANRILRALGVLLLASPLLPGLLRAQSDAVTLVALDPATGLVVPVELELARRWDVRLDPGTGAVTAIGARPGTVGPPPLLAFDPSSGALLAVDLVAARLPGSIDLDPRTGAPTPEGLAPAAGRAARGPILVGYDPVSGSLAPMRVALERQPGTFALDPRVGTLSPPPRGPALVGFDPATGSLAPVAVAAVRGSGGLAIDPGSGRVSVDGGAAPDGALSLLGLASDGSALVPTDLEVVYRPGLLTIDPGSGAFSFPEPPAGEARALTMLGVHSPTGALMRGEVEAARRPGAFTVDLVAGTVEQVVPVSEPETERADRFVFGGGLDVRQMLNLQDVLAEGGVGATGASATELAPGIHGFAEYRWRAFSVGVEAAYSVMDTEIRFPQGLQTGDLTYLEFGGNVKLHVPLEGAVSPYATFAFLRAQSEGDFELEGLTEQRTYESARGGIGAGFDYRITPLWGLRAEGLYNTTFEDSDAADHLRWRLAVTYSASEAR